MKKVLALGLLVTRLASGWDVWGASAPVDKRQFLMRQSSVRAQAVSTLENTYIKAVMDDTGGFNMGTVMGNPGTTSDDDADLLFGFPSVPSTSETMIEVDGFQTGIQTVGGTVTPAANSVTYANTISGIAVEEKLSIVTSAATGNPDTIEFYYKLTNPGPASHDVGLRIQLDTLLGSNDGAPFRVAKVGAVTKDLDLLGAIVPASALVLDSVLAPKIIAQFTFRYLNYVAPDRVVLGYWPAAFGTYDYISDPTRDFLDNNQDGTISGNSPDSDSSVLIYWGFPTAITLAAGESKEFAFSYGLGGCSQSIESPVSMLVCAPSAMEGQITGATYQYFPNPFTLTAFISNLAATPFTASVVLNKTSDLEFLNGSASVQQLSLAAQATGQVDWDMTANGRYTGLRRVVVRASGGGATATAVQGLTVHPIAGALYGIATDSLGNAIAGATLTAYSGNNVVGSATSQADGRYAIAGLNPGTYRIRLSQGGMADEFFEGQVVASGTGADLNANPVDFGAIEHKGFVYPSPVREDRAYISYYASEAGSGTFKLFDVAGRLVQSLPLDSGGAGWNTANWDTAALVNGVYLFSIEAGGTTTKGKVSLLRRVK